jgi:large subunit ribosomal protein L7/L12
MAEAKTKKAEEKPKKAEKKAANVIETLVEQIGELTIVELSDLVKAIEEKFDVEAAAPVMMAGAAAPGADAGGAAAVEQTEFDLVLTVIGDKKIQVIKVVRELTALGLKEAKDLVEAVPGKILEGVSKEAAEEAKAKLEEQGATAEVK